MMAQKHGEGREKKKLNKEINELLLDMMEDFANHYIPEGSRVFLFGTKDSGIDFTFLRLRDFRKLRRRLEESMKKPMPNPSHITYLCSSDRHEDCNGKIFHKGRWFNCGCECHEGNGDDNRIFKA